MAGTTNDLNDVITSAVLARVEAEVAAALSGTQVINDMVISELRREVEVRDNSSYRTYKTTFIRQLVAKAISDVAESTVRKLLAENLSEIETAVKGLLEQQVPQIAQSMVGKVGDLVASPYGIKVQITYPGKD